MTILTPMMGLAAAMIVVPLLLALYVLKLHRTRREVSSTLLWRSRSEDVRANALMQRLRLSPLFLLQCLILILLCAALMQPALNGWTRPGERVVLLIDHSASMQTLDSPGGVNRLDEAKRLAIAQVDSWQGGGLLAQSPPEVMVIAFAQEASVRIPFSTNSARVRQAIRDIEPTDQITRIAPAIALARALSNTGDALETTAGAPTFLSMQLYSDGKCPDVSLVSLRKNESISWIRCGETGTSNQGVSASGAERSNENPDLVNAFVSLRNEADTPVQRAVNARSNGQLIAMSSEPITLPAATGAGPTRAPGAQKLSFPGLTIPKSGVISVNLSPGDAFATDDRAVIAIQERQSIRVLKVGSDEAVEALLDSLPDVSLVQTTCQELSARMASDPQWTGSFDVVIAIDCQLPTVTAGRWLIFGPPPPIAGLNAYGVHPRQAVRTWRSEHKAMSQSQFTDLVVDHAAAISPTSEWNSLLEGSKGPLIVSGRSSNASVVYVGFLPMQSNWPFQRSFVNFMGQTIQWLGALGSAVASESLEPGSTLRMRMSRAWTRVVVTTPTGAGVEQQAVDGEVVFGPLRNVGVYTLDFFDEAGPVATRTVAVNLTDESECSVAAVDGIPLPTGELKPVSTGFSMLALWPWFVLLALGLLFLEWLVYHRIGGAP